MQKVLSVLTESNSMRGAVIAWGCEDSSLFVQGKEIGYTPAPKFNYRYRTVLEALADGWKLLAPPNKDENFGFEWWLTKD